MKVLTQIWRVVRVFLVAFVAQLVASGANVNKLSQQALIAAAVAGVEALYRQFVPPGEANPNGVLGNLIKAYGLIKDAQIAAKVSNASPAVQINPPPKATEVEPHPQIEAAVARAAAEATAQPQA